LVQTNGFKIISTFAPDPPITLCVPPLCPLCLCGSFPAVRGQRPTSRCAYHAPINARSASVICVRFPSGMIFEITAC
jgi:hypothetical protein